MYAVNLIHYGNKSYTAHMTKMFSRHMQLIRELVGGGKGKQTYFAHTFICHAKGTHVGDGQCTRCGHVYIHVSFVLSTQKPQWHMSPLCPYVFNCLLYSANLVLLVFQIAHEHHTPYEHQPCLYPIALEPTNFICSTTCLTRNGSAF